MGWNSAMTDRRFDVIVQALAQKASRRQTVQAVLAFVLGAASGARGQRAVAQETAPSAEISCVEDADCATASSDSCTGAYCDSGMCTFFIVTCIPGYICCGNGECCLAGEIGGGADTDCVQTSGDP